MTALRTIAAAGLVVALVAAASVAAASAMPGASGRAPESDATIVARTFSVAEQQVGIATATCPAGKRAVGGGVGQLDTDNTAAKSTAAQVEQSGPLDETGTAANTESGDVARSWLGSVFNNGPIRAFRMFVICSATSDATIEETAFSVAAGTLNGAVATCPAGKRVVGGGIASTGPSPRFSQVLQSGPLDDTGATATTESGDIAKSWSASVGNSDGDVTRAYRVFAICSATSDAIVAAKTFSLGDGEHGVGVATCPPGRRAVGGGMGETGPSPYFGFVHMSGPVDGTGATTNTQSGDVARSWYVFIGNDNEPREYKALALCASDPPPPKARCAGRQATIVGTPGQDTLKGTAGADVIAGLGGNDTISGLGGNDTICGGDGNDAISGGSGDDHLFGDAGNDRLSGGSGNDTLAGGPGNDSLSGGSGRNTLRP